MNFLVINEIDIYQKLKWLKIKKTLKLNLLKKIVLSIFDIYVR